MDLLAAIDVSEGRSVRLLRGAFSEKTVYGDPLEAARALVAGGARHLHVVDLDAARSGGAENAAVVTEIVRSVPVPVQVGGGVRSAERAEQLLSAGAARVVLGTAAVDAPGLLAELSAAFPGRIVAGLDHRRHGDPPRREVAVRGWVEGAGVELGEALSALAGLRLAAVVVTDISRDGTLSGPDLEGLAEVLSQSAHPVIASGGVGTVEDLRALSALSAGGRRLSGVIVGKALSSGALDVAEAVAACAP